MIEVVRNHHTPKASATHAQLTSLVHVADYAAYELGHGAPGAYPPPRCEESALTLVVAPVCRSWTKTSVSLFVSVATKFVV